MLIIFAIAKFKQFLEILAQPCVLQMLASYLQHQIQVFFSIFFKLQTESQYLLCVPLGNSVSRGYLHQEFINLVEGLQELTCRNSLQYKQSTNYRSP